MCGEKKDNPDEWSEVQGSPPRVRGKEEMLYQGRHSSGITPACAGKRDKAGLPFVPVRDHPRVCGEKKKSYTKGGILPGSPPRVRGKDAPTGISSASARITPACAGKSQQGNRLMSWVWDHPRVCGEKRWKRRTSSCMAGSPPRVRGKARRGACSGLPGWITPACAGKRDLTGS